jgi:hypothetical protein
MKVQLLALLSSIVYAKQLLLALEVSRHGAREPGKIFNFTKDPSQNLNSTNNLMPMGKRQHFELGARLRRKYIEDTRFLSGSYNEDEIHVESTYTNSTYLSSLYQLMGMFPSDFPSLKDYEYFDIGSEATYQKIRSSQATLQPAIRHMGLSSRWNREITREICYFMWMRLTVRGMGMPRNSQNSQFSMP